MHRSPGSHSGRGTFPFPPLMGLIILGICTGLYACSSSSAPSTPPVDAEPPQESQTPPKALPFTTPPPVQPGQFRLPPVGPATPVFPYLPDDDPHRTYSVGSVTDGYLINGRRLPMPHPHLGFMPPHAQRDFHYGTDELIHLLLDAADHIADTHPHRTIHVGNLSHRRGGNIPHSVSHNSGRDADIGFFVRDQRGDIISLPTLIAFDESGKVANQDALDDDHPHRGLTFDTTANWHLVEGLLRSEAAPVQFIFVSSPLRRKLLDEARRLDADPDIIDRAATVLGQPVGAAPHDNHFHIRIHCSEHDFSAGCVERGSPGPTFEPTHRLRDRAIEIALQELDHADPHRRRNAIQRLALLDELASHESLIALIEDPHPAVRIAAIHALRHHQEAVDLISARLHDGHPQVVAEAIHALSHHDGAAPLLAKLLRAPEATDPIPITPHDSIATATIAANALATMRYYDAVPDLIAALDTTTSPGLLRSLDQSLRLLTNHSLVDRSELGSDPDAFFDAWSQWFHDHADLSPQEWIARGFQRAGYNVDDLDHSDVWALTGAIHDQRHLNVNAQLQLKRLADHRPGSLRWHPHDANFFWRRYFERRQQALGLPTIPPELSTADGYTPPED